MSRSRLITLSLAALLAWSATAAVQAQGPGRGRGFGMSAEAMRANLLAVPQVQDELKLAGEQKSKIEAIVEQARSEMQGVRESLQNATQEERQKKFAELQEKSKARGEELAKLLSKEQLERLDQISLQAQGVRALADEKVAKALNVSDEQKQKLEAIGAEVGAKMRELGFGAENQDKRAELQKELTDKSLAVLSDEQRAQFAKMQGEKLDLPPGAAYGFGGGRRRQ